MTEPSRIEAEAERQRQLIDSLFALRADAAALATRESGARAMRGLQAYRINGGASAERALAAALPTVRMLLGEEDFEHLAREFWRAAPPLRGDLAEWGADLPAWVAAHEQLRPWPYLADCARLDLAVHQCERAADAALDAASLARLGDTDPSRLVMGLMPGLAVIESRWPVVSIHRTHHDEAHASFDAAKEAIDQARGESAIVSRSGWKGIVTPVDAATAQWTRQLLEGCDLATAIAQAGAAVDFTAWLTQAIQSNWLKEVRVIAD